MATHWAVLVSLVRTSRRAAIEDGEPKGYEGLPPLTALVVRSDTGMPGDGFPMLAKRFLKDIGEKTNRNVDWQTEFVMKRIFEFEKWDHLARLAVEAAEASDE